MVQAWLMDSSEEDQRAPHHRVPPQYLTLDDLKSLGVLYWKVSRSESLTIDDFKLFKTWLPIKDNLIQYKLVVTSKLYPKLSLFLHLLQETHKNVH